MTLHRSVMSAAEHAMKRYIEISQPTHFMVPENWLQSKIGEYFFERMKWTVVFEAPTNEDRWDCRLPNPLADLKLTRLGRADLLLFDPATRKCFLIEVKSPHSQWTAFAADAERIRECVEARAVQAGALVYVSCLWRDFELKQEQEQFAHWTNSSERGGTLEFSSPFDDPSGTYPKYAWQISSFVYGSA